MKKMIFSLCVALTICVMSFGQITSSIRSDGVILVGGTEFFPIGFYGAGYSANYSTHKAAMQAMAGIGCNLYLDEFHPNYISVADVQSFLNDAVSSNMKVAFSTPNAYTTTDLINNIVNNYKGYNAVLSWILKDDANAETAANLKTRHDFVKSADPNHVTTISAYASPWTAWTLNEFKPYADASDFSMMQSYPIGSNDPITDCYVDWSNTVAAGSSYNKISLPNVQTFSWWNNVPNPRMPTTAEVDVMTYMPICAGVKGMVWYYYPSAHGNTGIWNRIKDWIIPEINTMKGHLLNATINKYNPASNQYYSYWVRDNVMYLVVINSSTSSKSFSISAPSGYGSLTKVTSGRAQSLSLSGSTISGSVPTMSVEIYKLTSGGDTQAPSVPTGLTSSSITQTTFTLSWTASTDNVGVTGYEIFNAGVSVGTTTSSSKSITSLTCNTVYLMTVKARDAAGNWSAASTAKSVTTSACGGTSYTRIKNRWQPTYYLYDNGSQLGYGALPDTDYSTHWTIESVSGYSCFKNRSTGHYINIESLQAYTECTAVPTSYYTAQWTVSDVSGYKVIKNRYNTTEYLNIENSAGYVEHTAVPTSYYSAQWAFETTTKSVVLNASINSNNDNVIDVYPNPATSYITVSNVPANSNISAFTTEGKLISRIRVNDNTTNFDVTSWNKGMYFIQVQSEKSVVIKKVIVE